MGTKLEYGLGVNVLNSPHLYYDALSCTMRQYQSVYFLILPHYQLL